MASTSKSHSMVFVDKRKGVDRREDDDPCRAMPLDLFHRKRRKSQERRTSERTLTDDYYAYIEKTMSKIYKDKNKKHKN